MKQERRLKRDDTSALHSYSFISYPDLTDSLVIGHKDTKCLSPKVSCSWCLWGMRAFTKSAGLQWVNVVCSLNGSYSAHLQL